MADSVRLTRRGMLKLGAAGAGAVVLAGAGTLTSGLLKPANVVTNEKAPNPLFSSLSPLSSIEAQADSVYIEVFPTSPLILSPFRDTLVVPKALAPVPQSVWSGWKNVPGPAAGQQDSDGGTHSIWPSTIGYPDPIIYQVKLVVSEHSFTTSQVLPIDKNGQPTQSFDSSLNVYPAGTLRSLPANCIYGFNGTFPGARINAEYGKPVILRFENHLDENPNNDSREDYGSPQYGFLTHLHNGHTAPESDGNPYYRHVQTKSIGGLGGYLPGGWVDNLYLNYPAGGDDNEKQSFFWFHDHFHNFTGANVYKGMVGIYPIYDPKNGKDMGDETQGLRLPGVRTNNPDGSFDVDYDVPLVLYDVRLDDGVTQHKDFHGGNGETHPEWWGEGFFKHFPDHGFVGDIFTVNGTAYPVMEVKRRKYRLRFLDASVSRIYQFKLMSSTQGPKSAKDLGYGGDELQGQYRIPDAQQCMQFTQIATDGGLIPYPITRDTFELWPAKRREFVVDFTKYMDGSPTKKGDVIYLTNVMKMTNGRMWDSADPKYMVPVLKIVIGDDAPDNSVMPTASTLLRALPALPTGSQLQTLLNNRRVFQLQRGSSSTSPEIEWLINGLPFDETKPLAQPKQGSWEAWEIQNGGGGWVHPMHLHMEEHQVYMRNGKLAPDSRHPDDHSREDVVALDPSESVVLLRRFRTFPAGPNAGSAARYVAHCHNLAHEDHAMMFGWEIVP